MPPEAQPAPAAEQEQQQPPAPAADAQQETQPQQTDAGTQQAADVASLPPWAQTLITELRRENAQRRTTERQQAQQAQQAEEQRLQQSQQWQQLAEQRGTRITELERTAGAYDTLSQEITTALEAEIANWPEEVRVMRPAGSDAAELMRWTRSARPLIQRLTTTATAPAPGHTSAPRPAGTSSANQREQAQQALAKTRATF